MGLSSSIANAVSGLNVTSRSAELVSSNLANALNEGHSRREVEIHSSAHGGAIVGNVSRFVDRALEADLQTARAGLSQTSERAEAARSIEGFIGYPDDPYSIPAHLTHFDSALRFLESDAGSDTRLLDALSSATALVEKLNITQSDIQQVRLRADQQIGSAVESLNSALHQISELNIKIVAGSMNGRDSSSLLDHRQSLVDQVSELMPVRQMQRAHGAISLLSTNGMMLVESDAVQFDFTKTNQIMPHMNIESGSLGTLRFGVEEINTQSEGGPIHGGRLQALFDVRDQIAPEAQMQIDNFAFALSEKLQDLPNSDAVIGAEPGLFTDRGHRVDVNDQVGLAGRLQLNENVDPNAGGEIWRLRSGLGANTEGPKGENSLISDMIARLSENDTGVDSVINQVASLSSQSALRADVFEREQSFASIQFEQLNHAHLSNGVNTDAELQKLLQIENNYAANAKVLQTIDEMFSALMRIN